MNHGLPLQLIFSTLFILFSISSLKSAPEISPLGVTDFDFRGTTAAAKIGTIEGIGYDGIAMFLNGNADLTKLNEYLVAKPDLKLIAGLYVNDHKTKLNVTYVEMVVNKLADMDATLWLIMKGDPSDKVSAVKRIREIADIAAIRNVSVCLYPHDGSIHTFNTAEQALVLLMEANRPNVTLSVHLCHELRGGNGNRLGEVVAAVAPHIELVTISGANHQVNPGSSNWSDAIKPLSEGDFDVSIFLNELNKVGFNGQTVLHTFGLQNKPVSHYQESFNIYQNLIKKKYFDVTTASLFVPEGGATSFMLKLRALPTDTVTVNVSRVSGDSNLAVTSGSQLIFTPTNGTNWQQVTLGAAEDTDRIDGLADFRCSDANGHYMNITVKAVEIDNDNVAPVVNAGSDQNVALGTIVSWTPATILTRAWYDAADLGTVTQSSGAVSQWNDKSGNNRHAKQITSGNRPTYRASDSLINNLPSIGTTVSTGKIGLSTPSMSAKNVYVVSYYNTGNDTVFSGYPTLLSGPGNSGTYRVMGNQNTGNFITGSHFNDAGTFKNGTTVSSIAALPMAASIYKLKASTARSQVFSLGFNAATADRNWQGSYSEWIFTDGTENPATEQKIEAYLAHKWGLAVNLPASHPHKISAPTISNAIATLDGTVSDADGDALNTTWSLVSGPAAVRFDNASAIDTTATFSQIGIYTLRLTASDGFDSSFNECMITVQSAFDHWVAGGAGGSVALTFNGDSNTDGLADGIAWLLGANDPASNANTLLPAPHVESGRDVVVRFKYLKSDQRGTAQLKLQYSQDLGITDPWVNVTIPDVSSVVDGVEFIITADLQDPDLNQIQASVPSGDQGKLFVRLVGDT